MNPAHVLAFISLDLAYKFSTQPGQPDDPLEREAFPGDPSDSHACLLVARHPPRLGSVWRR
jgi:hypothetical protein